VTTFPGRIFSGDGASMDGRGPDLTQRQINAYQFRAVIQAPSIDGDVRPIAWVWLLDDDAAFDVISPSVVGAAVSLMRDWQAVLILARRSKVGSEVRAGLLDALDLALAPDDAVGHA
jgi:hypothetical protein